MHQPARHCILAVFAHPDDETSTAAGTLTKYAREGVDIHVVTATRGERGALGTGDLKIERRDLPAIREAELRAALTLYGAKGRRGKKWLCISYPCGRCPRFAVGHAEPSRLAADPQYGAFYPSRGRAHWSPDCHPTGVLPGPRSWSTVTPG